HEGIVQLQRCVIGGSIGCARQIERRWVVGERDHQIAARRIILSEYWRCQYEADGNEQKQPAHHQFFLCASWNVVIKCATIISQHYGSFRLSLSQDQQSSSRKYLLRICYGRETCAIRKALTPSVVTNFFRRAGS